MNKRHEKILDIIKNNEVGTQDELQARLLESGFDIAQATISRDMHRLNIVKTTSASGKYRYVQKVASDPTIEEKLATILKEAVRDIRVAMNIVVVLAYTGMASAACAAIDSLNMPQVVGSIAGDDTLILITESVESAKELQAILISDMNK